jgi:DNA-binding response OmpR family regulator
MPPLSQASHPLPLGRSTAFNPGKVLVVDDDPLVGRALRTTLTSAGYAVVGAMSGEEALERLGADGAVDLILMDLKMPGMGGVEACRRIRQIADIPILVISVLAEPKDKVQVRDAGADDYLVKPFGFRELLSRMLALRGKAIASVADGPIKVAESQV